MSIVDLSMIKKRQMSVCKKYMHLFLITISFHRLIKREMFVENLQKNCSCKL